MCDYQPGSLLICCHEKDPRAAALVDAAAVAALFNGIDRVADATGIPLEDEKAESTAEIRAAIGIDDFAAAKQP